MNNCGNCEESRRAGRGQVWCPLYGILINGKHKGCIYHDGGQKNGKEKDLPDLRGGD